MLQGPRPAVTTFLMPPKVVAASKPSTSTAGSALRRNISAAPGEENTATASTPLPHSAAPTPVSLHPSAVLRSCLQRDPLTHVPLRTELEMQRQATKRQLETLDVLLSSECLRLRSMNEAARHAIDIWNLESLLSNKADTVDPGLLAQLEGRLVEHATEGMENDSRYALYLSKFPRALLTNEQLADVTLFSERLDEVRDQMALLETLQLHETQALTSTEKRLTSLPSVMSSHSQSRDPVVHEPVAGPPVRATGIVPTASTSDVCIQEESGPMKMRPLWTRYFVHSDQQLDDDETKNDDQRCCMFIEELLHRAACSHQTIHQKNQQLGLLKQRIEEVAQQSAAVQEERATVEGSLSAISERCKELSTLLDQSNAQAHAAQHELRLSALRNLQSEESWIRQTLRLMEDTHFSRLQNLQLQSFLVYSSEQRQAVEEMLATERQETDNLRADIERREEEHMAQVSLLNDTRAELASMGADRALLRAKLDMHQQTARVDTERSKRNVETKDAELQQLRERIVNLEAQVDVYRSTTVTKEAATRAVQFQQDWDQRTAVKQHASKMTFDKSPVPRLFHAGSTSGPGSHDTSYTAAEDSNNNPRPRATQPPQPTTQQR